MKITKDIRKYMSKISKEGHKKSPRPKEFYQNMQMRGEILKRKRKGGDKSRLP